MGQVKALERYVKRWPNKPDLALRKEKFVRFSRDKDGYLVFGISKDSKEYRHRIHRLVAQYFLDNPNGYNEVNHIIPDKENNRASNLEWCSPEHNKAHAKALGLVNTDFKKKFTPEEVREIRRQSAEDKIPTGVLGRQYKVDIRTIRYLLRRQTYDFVD